MVSEKKIKRYDVAKIHEIIDSASITKHKIRSKENEKRLEILLTRDSNEPERTEKKPHSHDRSPTLSERLIPQVIIRKKEPARKKEEIVFLPVESPATGKKQEVVAATRAASASQDPFSNEPLYEIETVTEDVLSATSRELEKPFSQGDIAPTVSVRQQTVVELPEWEPVDQTLAVKETPRHEEKEKAEESIPEFERVDESPPTFLPRLRGDKKASPHRHVGIKIARREPPKNDQLKEKIAEEKHAIRTLKQHERDTKLLKKLQEKKHKFEQREVRKRLDEEQRMKDEERKKEAREAQQRALEEKHKKREEEKKLHLEQRELQKKQQEEQRLKIEEAKKAAREAQEKEQEALRLEKEKEEKLRQEQRLKNEELKKAAREAREKEQEALRLEKEKEEKLRQEQREVQRNLEEEQRLQDEERRKAAVEARSKEQEEQQRLKQREKTLRIEQHKLRKKEKEEQKQRAKEMRQRPTPTISLPREERPPANPLDEEPFQSETTPDNESYSIDAGQESFEEAPAREIALEPTVSPQPPSPETGVMSRKEQRQEQKRLNREQKERLRLERIAQKNKEKEERLKKRGERLPERIEPETRDKDEQRRKKALERQARREAKEHERQMKKEAKAQQKHERHALVVQEQALQRKGKQRHGEESQKEGRGIDDLQRESTIGPRVHHELQKLEEQQQQWKAEQETRKESKGQRKLKAVERKMQKEREKKEKEERKRQRVEEVTARKKMDLHYQEEIIKEQQAGTGEHIDIFNGFDSIDQKTAAFLYAHGYTSVEKLLEATVDDLMKIGVKKKIAHAIIDEGKEFDEWNVVEADEPL